MELLLWLVVFFVSSILLGFLLQFVFENIEKHKPEEQTKATVLLVWCFNMVCWRVRLTFMSLFRNKEKQYMKEMKKALDVPNFDVSLQNLLITEKKISHIRKTLEVVLQAQEKNRRKKEKPSSFVYQYCFLIRQHFVKKGPRRGLRLVDYYFFYVLKQKYVQGFPLPLSYAKTAMSLFGSPEEQAAIFLELNMKQEEEKEKLKYFTLQNGTQKEMI